MRWEVDGYQPRMYYVDCCSRSKLPFGYVAPSTTSPLGCWPPIWFPSCYTRPAIWSALNIQNYPYHSLPTMGDVKSRRKTDRVGMSWSRLNSLSQDSMENAGYKQSSTQKSEIVRTHTGPIMKGLYSKELAFKLWIHCKPQPTSFGVEGRMSFEMAGLHFRPGF